jgi:ABC-type bacteriocin/lantibiotic exporter with double-glycine peptidase domain
MLAFTRLMRIPNGPARDYQQKPNGKKLLVGMKKLKQRQFFHGVTNRQTSTGQIYWSHIFGTVLKLVLILMVRVIMDAIR